jgi:hypothetical protein
MHTSILQLFGHTGSHTGCIVIRIRVAASRMLLVVDGPSLARVVFFDLVRVFATIPLRRRDPVLGSRHGDSPVFGANGS